jgi:uncharacterized protein (UPF0303 family)
MSKANAVDHDGGSAGWIRRNRSILRSFTRSSLIHPIRARRRDTAPPAVVHCSRWKYVAKKPAVAVTDFGYKSMRIFF